MKTKPKTEAEIIREFDQKVEARIAFSHRRAELVEAWQASRGSTIAGARERETEWAKRIQLCNDAEIAILGGCA